MPSPSHGADALRRAAATILSLALLPAAARNATAQRGTEAAPAAIAWVHESWTVEDGLPVNAITRLIQSRVGYIWAATYDGLVRFDGVRFTTFNSANSEGLPSDRIAEIVETHDGALWLRTEQFHLVRFAGGRFTHIDAAHGLSDKVISLHESPTGQLWVGTRDGLGVIRDGRFVPVLTLGAAVDQLLVRPDGSAWLATGEGLYRVIDGRGERIEGPRGWASARILTMFEDRTGRLWVGTTDGVWTMDGDAPPVRVAGDPLRGVQRFTHSRATEAVVAYTGSGAVPMTRVRSDAPPGNASPRTSTAGPPIAVDSTGAIWHAVGPRLYRAGVLQQTIGGPSSSAPSPTDERMIVTALLVDREGIIWAGTRGAGLHRSKRALFAAYSEAEGLSGRNVYSVHEDRSGAIWAGTLGGGLGRIGADGQAVTSYPPGDGYPLSIYTMHADRDDRLWVGGSSGLLSCALPAMRCTRTDAAALRDQPVVALYEEATGRLWAGTWEGVVEHRAGRWVELAGWPVRSPIRAFASTRDGALWIATNGDGLVRYQQGEFTRVTTADGLPGDILRSLHEDRDGWLWVGTEGRGLARLDPRAWATGRAREPRAAIDTARRIGHVRVADGLFDGVIHSILADDQDRLWMSGNRGIFWVARAELQAFAEGRVARINSTSYTERDGLRNREANGGYQAAGVRARDGRLWFATQDGVAVVNPMAVTHSRRPIPVVVEAVTTRNRTLVASNEGRIALHATERDLEVDYTALGFLEPGNVRFRYRLEPYDRNWVEAGHRRTAFYTRVPPGDYTFHVEASDAGAAWSAAGAAISFNIAPYFRETTSAQLLLALLLSITAFAAFQWRLRSLHRRGDELTALVRERTAELRANEQQLEAQNARLAELHQLRSRLFANLSHEFRTPLTLILGPLRGLLDGRHGTLQATAREQHELMLRNGQRLLRLINQILDLARLQSGAVALERRTIDLVDFARSATIAFAPLADRQGIALTFRSTLPSLPLAVDSEQLEKVLLNLLSNALKFTPRGGSVQLAVGADEDAVQIVVRDDGVGIAPAELPHIFERFYQADSSATRRYEGTGIGLALARELVELHGGAISVESTSGVGSVFTVRLPRAGAPQLLRATPVDGVDIAEHAIVSASERAAALVTGERELPHAMPDAEHAPDADDAADRTTVLLVDDNADVRTYVRSVLTPTYRVIETPDGRAGLDAAHAALPDLIIADVMMPELDGLGLARALKGDAMTDAIPVVLLTARAAPEDHVAGLETGADAYLVKPFDPGVLEACVAGLLAGRRLLRERFRERVQHGQAMVPSPDTITPAAPSMLEMRLRPLVRARLVEDGFGPEALAAAAGMSYHQLYRALRDELETTPSRFIRGVRVECASELLRDGGCTVTEAAYAVGFESLSHFSRVFRERFGEPPSAHLAAK